MVAKVRTWLILIVTSILLSSSAARADDWPQWLGPKRDGIWRETGLIEKFPEGGPKIRWRTPISEGYAGPAVAQGKVVITDRLLASDAKVPDSPFSKNRVDGQERVFCLDEATGKVLWKHEYDCPYKVSYSAGPRCTPVISENKVYTLGAMGDLLCLDLAKGSVIWSKNLPKEYKMDVPLWGFAGHPLLDGDRLICLVGGAGSVAVAFDKNTGKELWRAVSDKEPGYAPPMIYEFGGKRELIIWDPTSVNGLDPESGKVLWTKVWGKQPIKANLSIPTPRQDGDRLFLTAFYDGPLMLRVNADAEPSVLWRGKGRSEQADDTDGLHSIMSTPFFKGKYIYGVCSYGELRCLNSETGERIWSTHKATGGKSLRWGNAFLVELGQTDRYVLFNELGDLIIANLTPKGYDEISRANILTPTNTMAGPKGRKVIWSHPAFANQCVYARNDREIVCVSMAEK